MAYTETTDAQPATAGAPRAVQMTARRGRTRDPLVDRGVDGNSVLGRRIRRAWHAYLAQMGHPADALARANAADAAELRVAVEDLQARLRTGENVSEGLVRLRNLFERSERKLGLAPAKRGRRGAVGPQSQLAQLLKGGGA